MRAITILKCFIIFIALGFIYLILPNEDGNSNSTDAKKKLAAKKSEGTESKPIGLASPFAPCTSTASCERDAIAMLHTGNSKKFTDLIDSRITQIKHGNINSRDEALNILQACSTSYRITEVLNENRINSSRSLVGCSYKLVDHYLAEVDSAVALRSQDIVSKEQRVLDQAQWLMKKAEFEDWSNTRITLDKDSGKNNGQASFSFSDPVPTSRFWHLASELLYSAKLESMDAAILAFSIPKIDKESREISQNESQLPPDTENEPGSVEPPGND